MWELVFSYRGTGSRKGLESDVITVRRLALPDEHFRQPSGLSLKAARLPSVRRLLARNFASRPSPSGTSWPGPRPTASLSASAISVPRSSQQHATLTGRRQHLLAREHGIGASHETHGLLRLVQRLPPSRKADDCRRKHDPCSRDRAQDGLVRDRLLQPRASEWSPGR